MTAHDDLSVATSNAITEYTALKAVATSLQTEVDTLTDALADATAALEQTRTELEQVTAEFEAYKASHPDTPPDPDESDPPVPPVAKKRIGMSATASEWDLRVSQVGEGVTARRLFVQSPSSNGRDKEAELRDCKAKGLLPVISYKVYGMSTTARNTWANACASFLASLDMEVLVVFNHEPNGDMDPEEYIDLQEALLPTFTRGRLKVGPLLNGWLLDRRRADFESWFTDDLLSRWAFMGMDSYQSGTEASPGDTIPGDRMAALLDVLADRGHPDKPIVIGEYNGWEADAIEESGETWLSTPSLYAALMFNSSTGGKGKVLSGDRLTAFQKTLRDPRTAK